MFQHQVVAIVKDRKERWKSAFTQAYQLVQKVPLFVGVARRFTVIDDAYINETPPAEHGAPQLTVTKVIKGLEEKFVAALDCVLTQDVGNCIAMADVECNVDGKAFKLSSIPASHLLYLEKQAQDILTFVNAIPVLDLSDAWSPDLASGFQRTAEQETIRTKKMHRSFTQSPATDKFAAQVTVFTEDVPHIRVYTTKYSGAITQDRKDVLIKRALAFQEAVKQAREIANSVAVKEQKEGKQIFDFIFGE